MERQWSIIGVDHVTVAVKDMDFWKKIYTEILGAEITPKGEVIDVDPTGPSSMKLYGLKWGKVRIALVQGIDRQQKSQVTAFTDTHGDHSFQHVALLVDNLVAFVDDMKEEEFRFLGQIQEREDEDGRPIRQVFAKGFDKDFNDAGERMFYEFVERPEDGIFKEVLRQDFSGKVAQGFYRQMEAARKADDQETFIAVSPSKDQPWLLKVPERGYDNGNS